MATEDVKEFKAFEKLFRTVVRAGKYRKRRGAERTLTPQMFKKLESGRLKPEEISKLLGSKNKDGTPFTLQDIQAFDIARRKAAKTLDSSVKGAPVSQLLAACWGIDLQRARNEIKRSMLYRVSGSELNFRTPAGPESEHKHHQVRVRLEEWNENLAGGKNCLSAVKKAAAGRISFDCDCGRHQYWFRYLATVGGYALKPYEFAFPKIRNPKLGGSCCKHAIVTLSMLKSPILHGQLAKEMEKQSEAVGFGDDKKRTRFLTKAELEELKTAGDQDITTKAELEKEWRAYQKAKKGLKKKLEEPETKKKAKELAMKKELEIEKLKRQMAETVSKEEIKRRRKLEDDARKTWISVLKGLAVTAKMPGMPSLETLIDNVVKGGASTTKEELLRIAKEEKLLEK